MGKVSIQINFQKDNKKAEIPLDNYYLEKMITNEKNNDVKFALISLQEATNALMNLNKGAFDALVDKYTNLISENSEVRENNYPEPEYLTTQDIAFLYGLSPQMVRKHCADGDIKGAYRLNDKGSWRITPDEYKTHPKYKQLLQSKYEEVESSKDLVETFKEIIKADDENND